MIVCIITKQRRRELGLLPGRNSHTKYAKYHFITLKLGFSCKETLYIISYFSDPICQIVITIYIKAHVLLQNKIWYRYIFFRLCYKWVFKSTFNNSYIVTVSHVDGRNQSTLWKPLTCHKLLTNFLSHWANHLKFIDQVSGHIRKAKFDFLLELSPCCRLCSIN